VLGGLPAAGSDAFVQRVADLTGFPVRRGGATHLLVTGDEYRDAVLDAIRGARSYVHWTAYFWHSGRFSRALSDAFVERAEAGVEVRVLLDRVGSLRASRAELGRLRAAGVRVERHVPARRPGRDLYRSNHRRAIAIDGTVGFTGGAGVADKWLGAAGDEHEWRDLMVRVIGSMARSLDEAFCELWHETTGERLPQPGVPEEPGSSVLHVPVASSALLEAHPLRLLYAASILGAQRRLWIASSYFVPDDATRRVVVERAQAGVDVRLLVPGPRTSAVPIRLAGHARYEEILTAGVRIFEFQPSVWHAKALLADDAWCVLGSANMDIRSRETDYENVLGIRDSALAAELAAVLEHDFARSQELRMDDHRRRGFARRLLERASGLLVEFY
jgi:cardiolipin synthase